MNKSLISLVLDFNVTLKSKGVTALCNGLATNSTLKKLSLRHCDIDEKGGAPIATVLKFKRLGLTTLDLTSNCLRAAGLIDLCDGLVENSSVKTLRIAENSIGRSDEDVKSLKKLADVLSKNTSLITADLGSGDVLALFDSVKEDGQITEYKDDLNMDDKIHHELCRMSTTKTDKKKGIPREK